LRSAEVVAPPCCVSSASTPLIVAGVVVHDRDIAVVLGRGRGSWREPPMSMFSMQVSKSAPCATVASNG